MWQISFYRCSFSGNKNHSWLGSHVARNWKKVVAIHNIIAAHELHLCAKTMMNENNRCLSTNLHSPYAKCFKIKAKKPWGKWLTWKPPSSRPNTNFNRKPDGGNLVTRLLDVRGLREMMKNLDVNLSNNFLLRTEGLTNKKRVGYVTHA